MNFFQIFFILSISILCLQTDLINADNDDERLQIKFNTARQRSLFDKFETKNNKSINYEFLNSNTLRATNDRKLSLELKTFLYESRIPFKEIPKNSPKYRILDNKTHRFAYDRKHMPYKDILRLLTKWRDIAEEEYKNKLDLLEIGRTINNVPIVVVKITDNIKQVNNRTKTSIFIESGIHAREWATIDTALFIMSEMIFDSYYKEALKKFVFHFLIVMNPDGYIHTWEQNRWWRKNLRSLKKTRCKGVDLNRNFDVDFKATESRTCNEDYKGSAAFSEKESQAERDYLIELVNNGNKIDLFLAFHSYGQQITYPYGYSTKKIPNWKESQNLSKKIAFNLEKYNMIDYDYGQTYHVIYPASGGSDDWTASKSISRFVFVMELRDKGEYGFFLPEDKIEQVAFDGLVALNTILNHLSPGIVKIKKAF